MIDRYQKRLDKARKEKTSYMSNSKWFKFFSAIQQTEIFLPDSQIKFLTSEEIFPFNFEAKFNENGKLDGSGGSFYFNEIVWIFKAISDYVAKNYPKAVNVKYSRKEAYLHFRLKGTHSVMYVAEFNEKNQKQRLELSENGQLFAQAKEIPLKKIPHFARSYIMQNYKNVSILYAERKYLFFRDDCNFVKSPSEKFYCIRISYEAMNSWTGELDAFETWVDFNLEKQYVGRIAEI